VLACLMVLVLSIAVLTTVNIGHNVHERIRLQNTADAAAYSMAAMEARAFNFYAFANRTQVSHYVSAMMWQSLNSFLFFLESWLVDFYGFLKSVVGKCAGDQDVFWSIICKALEAVPVLGQILRVIDLVMDGMRKVIDAFQRGLRAPVFFGRDVDAFLGEVVVPGHRYLNTVLAGASTAVMESVLTHVVSTSNDVIADNDRNLFSDDTGRLFTQVPMGLFSACFFDRAHNREGNGSPYSPREPWRGLTQSEVRESSRVALTKRRMGAVANATRYACDGGAACPETFISERSAKMLPLPDVLRSFEDQLRDWIPKWGQTRMLSFRLSRVVGSSSNPPKNHIRTYNSVTNSPIGPNAQGDGIGSDDTYHLGIGPKGKFGVPGFNIHNVFNCDPWEDKSSECWGEPKADWNQRVGNSGSRNRFQQAWETSIWAMGSGDQVSNGRHFRVRRPGDSFGSAPNQNPERSIGLNRYEKCAARVVLCAVEVEIYVANIQPEDGKHPWPGLAPFPDFEPGHYADQCLPVPGRGAEPALLNAALRKDEFNQPSSWTMLFKSREELRNPRDDGNGATRNTPALLNDEGLVGFKFGQNRAELNMDNRMSPLIPGLPAGMLVVSRGQTYYHRPGNWAEHPNFFNPYWRPRLAAVHQGLQSIPLLGELMEKLPPETANFTQKIITH
jgi:hypothetical protein